MFEEQKKDAVEKIKWVWWFLKEENERKKREANKNKG